MHFRFRSFGFLLAALAAACLIAGLAVAAEKHGEAAKHGGHEAAAHHKPVGMAPAEAMKLLQEGNTRFVAGQCTADVCEATRVALAKGQAPFAIVLNCSDSRVPAELIFDQGLGKLFIARVAGNVIDPALLGSIEYGVLHLGTRLIVVLGHESCGAITATAGAIETHAKAETPCIGDLVKRLTPAVQEAQKKGLKGKELIEEASVINAKMVARQICSQSAPIGEEVKKGEVKIVPAKYFLGTGKVQFLE
jgi:carbonic anhydrase